SLRRRCVGAKIGAKIFGCPESRAPMFNRKTVFVLGAGASKEFDMPIGEELAQRIRVGMDVRWATNGQPIVGAGDHILCEKVRERVRLEKIAPVAWKIRDGVMFSSSIDEFLDLHKGDEATKLLGKAAIVRYILEAEGRSLLFREGAGPVLNVDR